jgi:hypothetical protein
MGVMEQERQWGKYTYSVTVGPEGRAIGAEPDARTGSGSLSFYAVSTAMMTVRRGRPWDGSTGSTARSELLEGRSSGLTSHEYPASLTRIQGRCGRWTCPLFNPD